MNYTKVSIETKTEAVEAISHLLMEQGVLGVEIDDPKDVLIGVGNPKDWDYMEPGLIKADLETATVKAYFPDHMNLAEKIAVMTVKIDEMRSYLDVGTGKISTLEVKKEDWANEWKQYYQVTTVGENIIIKPTWEDYTPNSDKEIIIELDPGMAFGTGTHETTSMCMEILERYVEKGDVVLDIGAGSGILGITAAKLGAKAVVGVDLDEVAVKVAKENIELNKMSDIVDVRHGDLLDVVSGKGNIVVANIIADAIIYLSDIVISSMEEDGVFISSGIIDYRIDDVIDALEANFEIIEIKRDGEWAAIVAKKKGD